MVQPVVGVSETVIYVCPPPKHSILNIIILLSKTLTISEYFIYYMYY